MGVQPGAWSLRAPEVEWDVPTYRVQVHGTNFLVDLEGRLAKRGFLTVRVVEASDPDQAEEAAIGTVRETQRLRELVRNGPEDPPILEVEKRVELDAGTPTDDCPTGFIWYEDSPR